MTARQAKKILRRYVYLRASQSYREATYAEAERVNSRLFNRWYHTRRKHTPGWRWGRWDPKPSVNPKEVPF